MKTLSSGHPGCKSGIDCSLSRFVLNSTLSLMLVATNAAVMIAATPTLTFDSPSALSAEGVPINLGSHASPRLVDWNGDGALDLLLAGGDGYIWLFRQGGPANSTDFLAGTRVTASGSPIRVGTGYTGCCLADMDGDGRSDLVAAGNDNRVRYFSNIETLSSPAFGSSVVIRGNRGPFVLPDTVGGRIDVADWDGDGLWDLITGDFNGYLTWYRNTGTTSSPVFGAMGLPFKRSGSTLQEPYNTHPRIFDFNQDGVPSHWSAAYDAYWSSGAGAGFDRHWLRDNLKFCIEAPQEAFATLSNQYFTSSDAMLQLAAVRWHKGITSCINQFLLFADVYSMGTNQTFFYRVDTIGCVTRTVVELQRDARGHICGLTTASTHYDLLLDAEGNVLDIQQRGNAD